MGPRIQSTAELPGYTLTLVLCINVQLEASPHQERLFKKCQYPSTVPGALDAISFMIPTKLQIVFLQRLTNCGSERLGNLLKATEKLQS